MALTLNGLLRMCDLEPADVSVIFHTTQLPRLRRMLPWLAAERPYLFDAYQSVHSTQAERTLRNRPYVATFVPSSAGDMVFVGVYHIARFETLPTVEIYHDPRFAELEHDYGATDVAPAHNIRRVDQQIRFDMRMMDALADLRGRMCVAPPVKAFRLYVVTPHIVFRVRPEGEAANKRFKIKSKCYRRTYVRVAANLDLPVKQITAEPALAAAPPDWRQFIMSGAEVRVLPEAWAARLREWRGIYLIVDETDGARYVGSAYGQNNLLGRWQTHVAGAGGVTAKLRHRDPVNFRFSILERVSPDMLHDEIVVLEHTWMNRLHTRQFGLNA